MSRRASRQRRAKLGARAVPQTVSQLTGGLPSTSFFTPNNRPLPDPASNNPQPATVPQAQNDNTQAAPAPTNPRPPTPTAPPSLPPPPPTPPPPSPPPTPSPTNVPATRPTPSLPIPLPHTNATSDPSLHIPAANNSQVLAGSTSPNGKNPPISSPQQLSAAPEPTNKSVANLSSAALVHNTLPPNLIEAIVVVTVALALILGGIFYYCFKIKRREKRVTHEGASPSSEPDSESKESRTYNNLNSLTRSGSTSSSSHRVLNWPIDKKTIKVKKKTQSIISFGPGPEPEAPGYPSSVATLTDDPRHYLEKHEFSDQTFNSSTNPYGPSKQPTQPTEYNAADEISHIPISYEAKPPKARPAAPRDEPPSEQEPIGRPTDPAHLVHKKASTKRYNRISKAARKLVPARLITGVGIGKSPPPMPVHGHPPKSQHHQPSPPSKPLPNNKASVYPDDNYPTNYSYYQT
ncbi:hypothetical protein PTTG_08061 [Puccinia triticina 1-1 BBBD Race 1]|uniref:Uncharacterized protein n=1 Tax=Puccinia triticina (isolate 1-1 / race 1 (BBBD)) TaxID=630390 RepID=A0A180H555_PUCT1|nr:hypothetical protein PTTG_08061 [Puccinia triticina 1-1 BBBD Race 1]